MVGEMVLRIWDVEHGACAMLHHSIGTSHGRLAMIDSGDTDGWRPSTFIRNDLGRSRLDYLFITNADQDHMSDLQGLWDAGIDVQVWHRNPSLGPDAFRQIKEQGGRPLTNDAKRYLHNLIYLVGPVAEPFDQNMGGITSSLFWNNYPQFQTTNDLSLVVFINYGNFKILFPGDLEKTGWKALLQRADFRAELAGTDILVASHHGRENGFCEDIFQYFTPSAVVISDKAMEHETQETVPDYRAVVRDQGVRVATTLKDRHVLTTRRDGWIQFRVDENNYKIETEFKG